MNNLIWFGQQQEKRRTYLLSSFLLLYSFLFLEEWSSSGLVTSSFLHQYYITLYEGKRHQVKCMINAISMNEEQDVRNRVVELHRESIGELKLDPLLKEGEWRYLLHQLVFVQPTQLQLLLQFVLLPLLLYQPLQ